MKFKVFLRWMIPDLRHYESRLLIFRRFLYATFKDRIGYFYPNPHPPTPFTFDSIAYASAQERDQAAEKQADDLIARLRRNGLAHTDDGLHFFELREDVRAWRARRRQQQRKEARSSRTLKNYRKKILELLQKRITASRNQESVISLDKSAKKVSSRKPKSGIS